MNLSTALAALLIGATSPFTLGFNALAFPSFLSKTSPKVASDSDTDDLANLIRRDPNDVRYESLTKGFNQRFAANNCEGVYLIHTPQEAATALDDALEKFPGGVKIKSGGHCYEDFVTNGGTTAILDVALLKDWGWDDTLDEAGEEKGWYLSSGETIWGAFEKIYKEIGAVLPGGSCYSVGLGGHISGGGSGIMSRKYGLTVDWLTGVEIVVKPGDADAEIKYVSAKSASDDDKALFWAQCGGGGGNFGIITKFYFKALPRAPKGSIMSNIAFDWANLNPTTLKAILDWYVDFAGKTDNWDSSGKFPIPHQAAGQAQMLLHTAYFDEDGRKAAIAYHHQMEADLSLICPESIPKEPSAGHGVGFIGSAKPRRMLFRDSKGNPEELSDTMTDMPFYDSTQTMNPSGATQRGKYKSAYMKQHFPMEQVNIMFNWLTSKPDNLEWSEMKQSLIQVDCFGGQINTKDPKLTPIAQRNYLVKCQYQTYWTDDDNDEEHLAWIRGFYNEMYKDYGGTPDPAVNSDLFEGCYYNYPDVDLNDYGLDKALTLYFLDNYKDNPEPYPTLIKVKKKWDPNNIFNHAQSIPVVD